MEAIPCVISGAARPSAVRAAGGDLHIRPAENSGRPARPSRDEYTPEERMEPSGRYWPGKDENGQPRMYFDDPEKAADTPPGVRRAPKGGGARGRPEDRQPEREAPKSRTLYL